MPSEDPMAAMGGVWGSILEDSGSQTYPNGHLFRSGADKYKLAETYVVQLISNDFGGSGALEIIKMGSTCSEIVTRWLADPKDAKKSILELILGVLEAISSL